MQDGRAARARRDGFRENDMPRMLLAAFALLAAALLPAPEAAAQSTGFTTADVNMRAGPSTEYPRIIVLPRGGEVEVFGCVRGYTWCDVGYYQYRGWVSSRYISLFYDDYAYVPYPPRVTLPIITFDFGYWDTWYPQYPWYRDDRWRRSYRDWNDYNYTTRPRRNDDVIVYPRDRDRSPRRNDSLRAGSGRSDTVVTPDRNDSRRDGQRVDSRRNERTDRADRRREEQRRDDQRRQEQRRDDRRRDGQRRDDQRRQEQRRDEQRRIDDQPFRGGSSNGLRCAFGDPSCIR
jgi:uncharacterized protein YraI